MTSRLVNQVFTKMFNTFLKYMPQITDIDPIL